VKDPNEAVRVGEVVKVKVLAVDVARKRISLSIREATEGGAPRPKGERPPREEKGSGGLDLAKLEKAGFRVKKR